jgi:hypothetical protein
VRIATIILILLSFALPAAAQEAAVPPGAAGAQPPAASGAATAVEAPPPALVPHGSATARTGLGLVAISTPNSPWAVAQLHLRVSGAGLDAGARQHLASFARALAEGRTSPRSSAADAVRRAGGRTHVHLDADRLVITDEVPAAALSAALRAMDLRLRGRKRLSPAPDVVIDASPSTPPLAVRQLLAPGHPWAQTQSTLPVTEAALLAPVGEALLVKGGAVLVTAGPLPAERLLKDAERAVRAPLAAGEATTVALPLPDGSRVLEGARLGDGVRGPFSWLWFPTPGLSSVEDDAGLRRAALDAVIARLLGGEHGLGEPAGWLSLHVPLPPDADPEVYEKKRLVGLRALYAGPVTEAVVARARAGVRSDVIAALAHPAALCDALGRWALLGGGAPRLDAWLRALDEVTAAAVAERAKVLNESPRLIVRGTGGAAEGVSP